MSYSPNFRGTMSLAPSLANSSTYTNGVGSQVSIATPVSQGVGANFVLLDVTNESTVESFLGLTSQVIPSAASGTVMSEGRLENIPLGLGLAVGDTLWAGTSPGTMTTTKPDVSQPGWSAGMWVVFLGVVVQNQFNPSNQDIQIFKQIIGQL